MIEEEAKKKAPAKPVEKPVEKPDVFQVEEPEHVEPTHSDRIVHGCRNNDDFRKKYGDRWRAVSNAIAHSATHYERTKRDR
jgi:hypothetical protein